MSDKTNEYKDRVAKLRRDGYGWMHPSNAVDTIRKMCKIDDAYLVGSAAHAVYQSLINKCDVCRIPNDYDVCIPLGTYITRDAKLYQATDVAVCMTYDDRNITIFAGHHIRMALYTKSTGSVCGGRKYPTAKVLMSSVADKKMCAVDLFTVSDMGDYLYGCPLVHDGVAIQIRSLPDTNGDIESIKKTPIRTLTTIDYAKNSHKPNDLVRSRYTKVFDIKNYSKKLRKKGFSDKAIDDMMTEINERNTEKIPF